MAANVSPCQVNSATSIADPGIDTNAFGVKVKRNIYIVAATAAFTANGVACNPATVQGVNFGNNPFLVTGAVSAATVGTIWYYVE
mgnify:FL=1|jgi:hypothetical protein|tara:strand:+ start:6517 stop:6771 length:255 start_codon:yes stop_codon:yes gene_type:complete